MRRLPTKDGRKWVSKRGWLFIGIGGSIYAWHIEVGPFSIAWDRR